jgi:hypothetical protein
MNGTQPLDSGNQLYKIAQVPTEWKIIGTGDFNNDGHGDILWRHDSGVLAIWEMAGTGVKNGYWLETTVPDLPALSEKPFVADFNGDGVSDLLWQGKRLTKPDNGPPSLGGGPLGADDLFSSNYTYLSQTWTMAAGSTAPATVKTGSSISRWTAAVGQFDGAGGIDRFSRAFDGETFFELSSGSVLPGPSVSAEWEVKAVGDFDGDGTSDLLWHNQQNGIVSVWQVQNGTYKKSVTLAYVPVAEWQVLGAADVDGDGVSEILWRNKNGQVSVWLMSNFAVKEFGPPFMVPLEWEFAGILATKTPLGAFQAWTYDWVKSSVQCMAQSPFQITGPKPETVVRGFDSLGVTYDVQRGGYKRCISRMAEPFVNITGEYRMETSKLGGFDFIISPYSLALGDEYCPSAATCSPPSSTPPPMPGTLSGSVIFDATGTTPFDQTVQFSGRLDQGSGTPGMNSFMVSKTERLTPGPADGVAFSQANLAAGNWTVTAIAIGITGYLSCPVTVPSGGLGLIHIDVSGGKGKSCY